MIRLQRAYLAPNNDNSLRILVDRLWPRGIKKANAAIDLWLKDVAPSSDLRKWFNHEVEKWPEFQQRYLAELADNSAWQTLQTLAQEKDLTLVFAAKDEQHNNAVILKSLLDAATQKT